MYFWHACATKLRFQAAKVYFKCTSLEFGSVLRMLRLCWELKLRQSCDFKRPKCTSSVLRVRAGVWKCTSHATLVLGAEAEEVYFRRACATKLRFSSWRFTYTRQSCDVRAEAAEVYLSRSANVRNYKVEVSKLELRNLLREHSCTAKLQGSSRSCVRTHASRTKLLPRSKSSKLRSLSWSCRSVRCTLHLRYDVSIFSLELTK